MAATERQKDAITTHDKSTVVTAGAGTGKTFVLVQKYIDLIATKGVPVPAILALTFTDKAATEMKERIRREIQNRSGPTWEKAADDFMVAPVQTFHAFCAQVLREFPIEAGIEPGFVVLDEQQMARIHARSFEDLVHTRQEGPVQEAAVYVLSATDQNMLRGLLSAMYAQRSRYLRFFDLLEEDEADIVAVWQREVHAFRDSEIQSLLKNEGFCALIQTLLTLSEQYGTSVDKAAIHLREISGHIRQLESLTTSENFCGAVTALLAAKMGNVGSKKNWAENDLETFKQARRSLLEILGQKTPLLRMNVDPADPKIIGSIQFLRELGLVFRRYLAIVSEEKAVLGGLDFYDLILYTRTIFTEKHELVATHFAGRYRYILVDEFQDTDPAQFEIVLSLVGEPSPTTDCLFIVGDPKQSIYLFREADVTRFKEAQKIVELACSGKVVDLDTSFRSTNEVIGLANILFAKLFGSVERPWEFGYEAIKTSPARMEHKGSVELMLPSKGIDSSSTKRNEAEMVARRVHSLVNAQPADVFEEIQPGEYIKRQARYGDIAILLEQRTNLSYYLSSLSRAGIPYYVHGGTGFYGRQEICDLYNLLSFLENAHSDVSLFGVLRSPYCGMSDAELFFVSQERGVTIWQKLQRYAEHGCSPAATRAATLLNGWKAVAGRTGLVFLIRKILTEAGMYTVYAALPEGEQILANIEKLIAIIRSREEEGYALSDLTADLRMAMDEEEREGEAPLDALAENAVNIMTVHAAKGLEFPIVIVPDMGMPFHEKHPSIMIGDDPRLVGIKVPDPKDEYALADTPVLTALRMMQGQKERAERKRLLYVALTRARDHLIMSGTMPEDVQPPEFARTRIEWIWSALGIGGDAIRAGEVMLDGWLKLGIVSDPLSIPAEMVEVKHSLIEVPSECAGCVGTWKRPEYSPEQEVLRPVTVSELEELAGVHHPRLPGVSKYLASIDGAVKGAIIHEVLRGWDAGAVCAEYGVTDPLAVGQCEEILIKFFATDLMKNVKRSFCELPFVVPFGTQRVTGKIDRLCQLSDGSWIVIDYKSEVSADYSIVANEYALSLSVYVEAARQIVQAEIEGWLYFTETGEFNKMKKYDSSLEQKG